MVQLASLSLSKRSMPSREGTGNCVTTSAATRLAASGWLFIEDSLEEGTRPWGRQVWQGCIMSRGLASSQA